MGGVAGIGNLWTDSRLEVCKFLITLTSPLSCDFLRAWANVSCTQSCDIGPQSLCCMCYVCRLNPSIAASFMTSKRQDSSVDLSFTTPMNH